MTDYKQFYIGGEWVDPAGSARFDVVNPATLDTIGSVPEGTEADVDRAVAAARAALESGPWANSTKAERLEVLRSLQSKMAEAADELANLVTAEVGATILFSHFGQIGATNMVLDAYVNVLDAFEFEELRQDVLGPAIVRKEPVGVVAGIIPWNVPLFISMLKFAPALASGSTMVLKPAPDTPLSAFRFAEIAADAGVPAGVLNIVPADREVSEYLVRHPDVDKVSFTGSTAAGRKIGAICGEQLKRCTLELGGKSAAILLDDVDIEGVADELLSAAIMNNGQACVAQTRVLAPQSRYDEIVGVLSQRMADQVVGDPTDFATNVGPLINEAQRDRVEGYIAAGTDGGARVAVGGARPQVDGDGWFVEPTLFVDVTNDMRIAQEEIFGPVVSVIAYSDVDDAVRIANDSDYGLSGSVWGADV
ncbi:MAG TPA: aldehyde dehydrogenase, partial [Microthrixaceae bacterium]|nr:aldehyde dehydrogenase [Microthrixaceae bacterium]